MDGGMREWSMRFRSSFPADRRAPGSQGSLRDALPMAEAGPRRAGRGVWVSARGRCLMVSLDTNGHDTNGSG